jgi:2-oxoglutarate ferredoxin oxidoreductase subunit alpha
MMKGAGSGKSRFIRGLILDQLDLEEHNWKLARKYNIIEERETRCELYQLEDAEVAIVAYGTSARVAKGAIKRMRNMGMKVGLFRPITLWPFPTQELRRLSEKIKCFLVFELSLGQMIDDVRLALQGYANVGFFGRPGGVVPTPIELANIIQQRYFKNNGHMTRG